MTIALTNGSHGGLVDRLGSFYGGGLDLLALLGGAATARVLSGASWQSRAQTLDGWFNVAPLSPSSFDGFFTSLLSWQNGQTTLFNAIQSKAQQTLMDMADADQRLASKTVANAMALLIQQMKSASASVNASAPSAGAQTAVGTPVGNAIIVPSVKRPDGLLCEYLLPELVSFLVTSDSTSSASLLGAEPLSATGQAAAPSAFDYRWPMGSGATASLNLADGSKNYPSGNNLLVNSDFTTFTTTNNPDNFTITVGAATTNVLNGGSGNAYTPSGGSLQILGDGGGTLTALTQALNTASVAGPGGGSPFAPTPLLQLALNLWVKCSATPAAGVLEFALVDGSGVVINDQQGNANLFTKSLTAVSTTFVNVNGVFRLPFPLPAAVKLRLRLSTAIDSGKSVYLGRMALAQMKQLYAPHGPSAAGFSGSTRVLAGDGWTVNFANTFGVLQREFFRYFNMPSLGLQLPSSGSPTLADSLAA